jgi:hypothetical protein
MKDVTRLFILLTYLDPSAAELDEIKQLVSRKLDWDFFKQLLKVNLNHSMIHQFALKAEVFDKLPQDIQSELSTVYHEVAEHNQARIEYLKVTLKRFEEEKLNTILLKGICLAHTVYNDPTIKRSNDVDLLSLREEWDQIRSIYEEQNFFPIGERVKKDDKVQKKVSHATVAYVSQDLKCVMGTLWGIKTHLGPYKINYDELYHRARTVELYGSQTKIFSPEDTLLHLSLHFGYFKTQLKDLSDIYNLIRYYRDDIDWDLLVKVAIEYKAANHVYQALVLSHFMCPMDELPAIIKQLEPYAWGHYKSALKKKVHSMDDFLVMSTDYLQVLEFSFMKFINSKKSTEKIKFFFKSIKAMTWPEDEDFKRIHFELNIPWYKVPYYRLKSFFVVTRAAGEELGHILILGMYLKLFVDTFIAVLTLPFFWRQKSLEDYSSDLGLTKDQMEKLENSFH